MGRIHRYTHTFGIADDYWATATVNDINDCIRRGGNIKRCECDGMNDVWDGKMTYFHIAARWTPHPTVITHLVWCGLDINARDRYGQTPLCYAHRNQHRAIIVPIMIRMGADPESRDNYKNIPESNDPVIKRKNKKSALASMRQVLRERREKQRKNRWSSCH